MVYNSSLGKSIASEASMPYWVMSFNYSHLIQVFIAALKCFFIRNMFNDFSFNFHIDNSRLRSKLSLVNDNLGLVLCFKNTFSRIIRFVWIIILIKTYAHGCIKVILSLHCPRFICVVWVFCRLRFDWFGQWFGSSRLFRRSGRIRFLTYCCWKFRKSNWLICTIRCSIRHFSSFILMS